MAVTRWVSERRPWPERLLGIAVLLLVAALALRLAVDVVLSVLWPLFGLALGCIVLGALWWLWQRNRTGW